MNNDIYFTESSSIVSSDRVLYTPSSFARASLLYLQEIGTLRALKGHQSSRTNLSSYLFFTVLSGSGKLVYDNKSYHLAPSSCVFIDCMKPYSHETDPSNLWSLRWCHFNGPTMPHIYQKYLERGGKTVFMPTSVFHDSLLSSLDHLYTTASSFDYIRDMKINEGLSSLLTLLMSESWHPEEVKKKSKKSLKESSVGSVKEYLDENYGEAITLDELSNRFFINKYYLSRVFKEQIGMTVNEYLNSVRITKAKSLLRFSDKTIMEISAEVGVEDPAYFSRMFKKIEGVSPDQYRKQW